MTNYKNIRSDRTFTFSQYMFILLSQLWYHELRNYSSNHILKGSSLIFNTSVRHEQQECDTSASRLLHEWHEYDTSAKRTVWVRHEWQILVLITTQIKTCCHTPIFTIWQVKDYKQRNNFILRTTFWKCLAPMPKCVWKVHQKNWTF